MAAAKPRSILFPLCLIAMSFICAAGLARAGQLDPSNQDAVNQTKQVMTDPEKLKAATANDPQAKQADENAERLMGNKTDTADLYKLSADIFGNVASDANGDPAKMQESLNQALKNPAGFADSLTPDQAAKLHQLTNKVESRKPSNNAP
jgi:hypothetical protein